jgi:large subunit ribosomal protein L21
VLLVGGDNPQVGDPTVAGAKVMATVLEQGKGPKIIVFKKRRRKNFRRRTGHRQLQTVVRIADIMTA